MVISLSLKERTAILALWDEYLFSFLAGLELIGTPSPDDAPLFTRTNLLAPAAAAAAIYGLKGDAGLHRESGHVGCAEAILKLIGGEKEIDLTGFEFILRVQRGYVIVEVETVGVAHEKGRCCRGSVIESRSGRRRLGEKNLRDFNRNRELAQLSGGRNDGGDRIRDADGYGDRFEEDCGRELWMRVYIIYKGKFANTVSANTNAKKSPHHAAISTDVVYKLFYLAVCASAATRQIPSNLRRCMTDTFTKPRNLDPKHD
nr:hypothetical protein Iba_chr09aCG13270 [Ipomoea batatas]